MPIRELSKNIASKIAAGEVVERPASVVKELIENAIDAGASEITIRIEQAGQRLIEVADNGSGITAEEISLAVRRYATSKISSIEDLNDIRSLGFRGEALASIAAVSRFTLESRSCDSDAGTSLFIDGGDDKQLSPVGIKQGTIVRVENLFFNVPARKKFLKKDSTERQLITEIVTRYALFYSDIRITLSQEGRSVFSSFGNGNRREILAGLFSLETAQKYLEIDFEDSLLKVVGFTSPLDLTFSNRKQIVCFINGRLVSDPTITAAVIRAYHGYLMVGRFPGAIIFLGISPDQIDVNVHPTKDEIRFRDSGRIFSLIHSAIRKSLTSILPLPGIPLNIWNTTDQYEKRPNTGWDFINNLPDSMDTRSESMGAENTNQDTTALIGKVPILRAIGQLGRTYIVAEGPDGLYLIDQHAAHERILYESMQKIPQSEIISQFLITPDTLQIPAQFKETFHLSRPHLEKIGFKFEDFGPNTVRIIALPQVIKNIKPSDAILGALEPDTEQAGLIEAEIDRRLIIKICKRAAIKGGQVLTSQEQGQLIRDLENCEFPRTCPHGRPTMIHLSVDLLERQFGRLGSR